ncbi:hypothetical protein AX777_06695 [Sphingobium yanoikuyae]|uniref:Uncharacterized protein n=1 Tax=Sphingobium yanoikuyae TaxID=13690 RepID=A0A177JWD4_SPHYA|nr:hypothetical protein AX777_06695 [Sphingobium yanoikuyae]PZU53419.1 MAG: hypothetical protein DI554_19430 [Sphingobium sp.]
MAELLGFVMGRLAVMLAMPVYHMVHAGRGRLRRFPYAHPTPKKTNMCLLRNDRRNRRLAGLSDGDGRGRGGAACLTGGTGPNMIPAMSFKVIFARFRHHGGQLLAGDPPRT